MRMRSINWLVLLVIISSISFVGCSKNKDLQRVSREQAATIQSLNAEIQRLNDELDAAMRAREELYQAQAELEKQLKQELADGDMTVAMEHRGLVLTMLSSVLFDSGKAELKDSALEALNKVSDVLDEKVKSHVVYVEGHTDNVPIAHSGWRSNWELSTARATQVIHHLIDKKGISAERLAAVGYGEFHPVESNETSAGRQKNRRVEIVISPKKSFKDA